MGEIRMVMAKTNARLAILEPITFPKAKSEWPDKEDCKLTMSSGAEVAKETTVIPMTILGTRMLRDSETAAFINHSPPLIRSMSPEMIARNSICQNIRSKVLFLTVYIDVIVLAQNSKFSKIIKRLWPSKIASTSLIIRPPLLFFQ